MKDHIFISDFDGTITHKDFYWIVIDDYIGEKGRDHYFAWKKKKKIGLTFLNKIFTWHPFTQAEHDEILSKITIDSSFKNFDTWTQNHNMDLMVLSAGFLTYPLLPMKAPLLMVILRCKPMKNLGSTIKSMVWISRKWSFIIRKNIKKCILPATLSRIIRQHLQQIYVLLRESY